MVRKKKEPNMNPKFCAMATGRTVMLRGEKGKQVSEMMDWRYIQKQIPSRKKISPFPLYLSDSQTP